MRVLDFFKTTRSLSLARHAMQDLPSFNFGSTGSDELIARRPDSETPEFDITAMVDLVFMMNIYFLVTFVTVAMGEINSAGGQARARRSTPRRP